MSKFIEAFIWMSMLVTTVAATRSFNIILSGIECIADSPEYFSRVECSSHNIQSKSYVNACFKFSQEVNRFDLKARANIIRSTGTPPVVLFDLHFNGCDFLEKINSNNILKVIFDGMRKSGNVPERCPIPANEDFCFSEYFVDPEMLPMYTPEFSFSFNTTYFLKSKTFLRVMIKGRTETKRKNIFKNKN